MLQKLSQLSHRHPSRSRCCWRSGASSGLAAIDRTIAGAVTPVYVAGQPVLDAIVGFPPPSRDSGARAIARPCAFARPAAGAARGGRRWWCCGALPRRQSRRRVPQRRRLRRRRGAAGCATSCDPLYRKAIRVSVGETLPVPHARLSPRRRSYRCSRGTVLRRLAESDRRDSACPSCAGRPASRRCSARKVRVCRAEVSPAPARCAFRWPAASIRSMSRRRAASCCIS